MWRILLTCAFIVSAVPGPAWAGDDESDQDSPAAAAIRFYQAHLSDLRHGQCAFSPSCSRYALEAIRSRGLLVGTALTADRLVRCHAGAKQSYRLGSEGRLIDPVDDDPPTRWQPVVPAWMLPPIAVLPPVIENPPQENTRDSSIRGYAEFARQLEEDGDCWRATTEYKRIAFLEDSPAMRYWTHMRSGWCLYRHGDADEAPSDFLRAAIVAPTCNDRNNALLLAAASYFDTGKYARCEEVLDEYESAADTSAAETMEVAGGSREADTNDPDAKLVETQVAYGRRHLLQGLTAMAVGNWNRGSTEFRDASETLEDPKSKARALFLESKSREGVHLPGRSRSLATLISVLLPGSGHVYTGRYTDGFRHFLFNGLLAYWLYRLVDDENYAGTYLVATVELPFYLGNILGAGKSAVRFNTSERMRFLSRVIAATED